MTGAGDYDLPSLIGSTIRDSIKRNQPVYTFKGSDRSKLSWFPTRHVEFQGKDAPPSTNYSPDIHYKNRTYHFSVGKKKRFDIPNSIMRLWQ